MIQSLIFCGKEVLGEEQDLFFQVVNVNFLTIVLVHIAICGVMFFLCSFPALCRQQNKRSLKTVLLSGDERSGSWASSKLHEESVLLPCSFNCIPLDLGAVLASENKVCTLKPQANRVRNVTSCKDVLYLF